MLRGKKPSITRQRDIKGLQYLVNCHYKEESSGVDEEDLGNPNLYNTTTDLINMTPMTPPQNVSVNMISSDTGDCSKKGAIGNTTHTQASFKTGEQHVFTENKGASTDCTDRTSPFIAQKRDAFK